MAGLVPAIHVFLFRRARKQDVDARDKRGHDDGQADSIRSEPAVSLGFPACAAGDTRIASPMVAIAPPTPRVVRRLA
jgi:hypothetical protein